MDDIHPTIETLSETLTTLTAALDPLLTTPLTTSTATLPLLDKAKLYVLATYALESILFSYLRLNGVDAKEHPVYQELTRVKEYFGKISGAENAGKGKGRIDVAAAGRFIKAGLAGNQGPGGAKRKFEDVQVKGTHTRFEGAAKRTKAAEDEGEKVGIVRASEVDEEEEQSVGVNGKGKKTSKKKLSAQELAEREERSIQRKEKKKAKRDQKNARAGGEKHPDLAGFDAHAGRG